MPEKGSVVVTGAAGFIGSHLTERLLDLGYDVIGIDSFEDYYDVALKRINVSRSFESEAFKLVKTGILELAADTGGEPQSRLHRLLLGADAVFHLAAQAGVRKSWGRDFAIYTLNNVRATQAILEAAKAVGVPKVVYASSSSVYGDTDRLPMSEEAACWPHSPYGVTKLAAEHLCSLYMRNFGLNTASFRFFTVYGPRQRPDMAFNIFMRSVLEGRSISVFGDGTQTRDFTFVDDIVDGLLLGLDPEVAGIYNFGGGSRVSLNQAIDVIEKLTHIPVERVQVGAQAGDVRDTWAALHKAREIGYSPSVSLEEGLAREWEWLSELLR